MDQKADHEVFESDWNLLLPHLERDAVILVSPELDLLTVAREVAEDHSNQVGAWIAQGKLAKPSLKQIEEWGGSAKKFRIVIVQPYVLAQELLLN